MVDCWLASWHSISLLLLQKSHCSAHVPENIISRASQYQTMKLLSRFLDFTSKVRMCWILPCQSFLIRYGLVVTLSCLYCCDDSRYRNLCPNKQGRCASTSKFHSLKWLVWFGNWGMKRTTYSLMVARQLHGDISFNRQEGHLGRCRNPQRSSLSAFARCSFRWKLRHT